MVLEGFGDASHLVPTRLEWRQPRAEEILVRVHASSVNPIEWKMREGMGLPKCLWGAMLGRPAILGIDFAGEVVAAACGSGFAAGAEVMGALPLCGAHADYILVDPSRRNVAIALKPPGVSHEVAALLPFAGLVALAGLTRNRLDQADLQGKRVLILGASGGVGHVAVQLAKRALRAACVTAICSRRNADFVRSCGADEVVAYDEVDVSDGLLRVHPDWEQRFDLIFDTVGDDRFWRSTGRKLLKPNGRFSTAALPTHDPRRAGEDIGPGQALPLVARLATRSLFHRYHMIPGLLGGLSGTEGLKRLAEWLERGAVVPHLACQYPLDQLAAAHRASESGRTVGKISVTMTP